MIVNLQEAKEQFTKIINDFINGETVIIAKDGKPFLKFVKIESDKITERQIGFFNCHVDMTAFDDPIEGLEEYK